MNDEYDESFLPHVHTYALSLRKDAIGTPSPWRSTLVNEVAPRYRALLETFKKQVVKTPNKRILIRYGPFEEYLPERRVSAQTVLELLDGVNALQALLDNVDAGRGKTPDAARLSIDLSALIVEGDLDVHELPMPQWLCYQTQFEGDVNFSGNEFFCQNTFEHAHFKGNADFENTHWRVMSNFDHAIFADRAGFFCAMGYLNFHHTVFIGYADFEGLILDGGGFEKISLLGSYDFS